ncbi:MAG: hypothetical protein A3B68_02990 [Candidatus Melainabacteria bacterium RIFCSPHIGHO2_02_FULL_34_12]|nr:MAG: hypothetical protein A3B68_02990 [Candidatus Melainabacteria bacterium RIFCSPHIGHO2_02_FULL_34_12]
MAEFCKVCGIKLSTKNTVDYRPGSCRDCELERKKLYSGLSFDFGSAKSSKKLKSKKKDKLKLQKLKGSKKGKKDKTLKKKLKLLKSKLKKQKFLKDKKIKAKKLAQIKKLTGIRAEREKKKKKLRAKLDKLRKLRIKKALKIKLLKKKQKIKEKKAREKLKLRVKKAREGEKKLLQKEKEYLRKEKDKLRQVLRQEKEGLRAEKRAEKERIRTEKQRVKSEKHQEKERLKKAKEAAKLALIQAREAARQAAQEARRLREEAKKPALVSVVTKLKEMQPPPDVKIITPSAREQQQRPLQPTKVIDPKKPASVSGTSSSLLESATVIPAKADVNEEKNILKQSLTAQHNEVIQKEVEKLQKDTDPIIDRYNPYTNKTNDPDAPRAPSPTPWLASNFSVVKGDFKESKQEEGSGISSGLSEQQVKDIIEKIKTEHKRKST